MNSGPKKIAAALAVTAFTLVAAAAPATAGPKLETQRTVWCC